MKATPRLLVDPRFIKYVTIESSIYAIEDMTFGPSLATVLLPLSRKLEGLIARDADTGQPYFARAAWTAFPGVASIWHGTCIEYTGLKIGEKLRMGVSEATHPTFDTVVAIKFTCFVWEIQYVENETTAYHWIEGHDIGPRFLGQPHRGWPSDWVSHGTGSKCTTCGSSGSRSLSRDASSTTCSRD